LNKRTINMGLAIYLGQHCYGFGYGVLGGYDIVLDEKQKHHIYINGMIGTERFRNKGGVLRINHVGFGADYRYWIDDNWRLSAGLFAQSHIRAIYFAGDDTRRFVDPSNDLDLEQYSMGINLACSYGSYKKGIVATLGYYRHLRHFLSSIVVDEFGENIERQNLFIANGFYLQLEMNLKKF
ncbi:MAG: hypothetical protein JJU23_12905, partial [Cyclobacteriaceae bacterium]|nr:hypothetical protein [Cyclobacteriaceae bacterium]